MDPGPRGRVPLLRGVPRRLVPDNLKTGVDKPDLYDPKINKSYAELAVHYGTLVSPGPRIRRTSPGWSGPCPTSGTHSGADASSPPSTTCRPRPSPGRGRPPEAASAGRFQGAAPLAVFEASEAEALLPLPETPFVLAKWSTATVGPDIHIKVGRTLYSVPWS